MPPDVYHTPDNIPKAALDYRQPTTPQCDVLGSHSAAVSISDMMCNLPP